MQRALLEMGADSYRFKPVSTAHVSELVHYAMQKRRPSRRRGSAPSPTWPTARSPSRARPAKHSSPSPAPSPSREVGLGSTMTADAAELVERVAPAARPPLQRPPRRAPRRRRRRPPGGGEGARRRARARRAAAVAPERQPRHRRTVRGGRILERRELCDGTSCSTCWCSRRATTTSAASVGRVAPRRRQVATAGAARARGFWFRQLAAALMSCHAHGAVHGQLHPENVLLRGAETLQVVGFSSCAAGGGGAGRNGDGEGVALM